jgi:bifunctional non-homologous end joining protein LigD
LLVGYNSPEGLQFAGRVGTGFSEKLLASVDAKLQKLKRPTCPFINLPEKTRGRWGQGITPAVMKRCQWLKPVLVAQVKFTEWTLDDQLRQPVFLGLRAKRAAVYYVFDVLLLEGKDLRNEPLSVKLPLKIMLLSPQS